MSESSAKSDLEAYFDRHHDGPGIWKWRHYFPIYERFFSSFRGHEVHVLEIGVYSGGSLAMWRDYFGSKACIYGVDIEPACKAYAADRIKVLIGDQGDRAFWRQFRAEVPMLDIVIDDGSHVPQHQATTLAELLPHLRPGGVFLCEDITGSPNDFASYVHELAHNLNAFDVAENMADPERRLVCRATSFQANIEALHLYPFVVVIERRGTACTEFTAPKHGTRWEPFLR